MKFDRERNCSHTGSERATPRNQSVPNPRTRTNVGRASIIKSARTTRYRPLPVLRRPAQNNAGIGGFSLPSTGYYANSTKHTVQNPRFTGSWN